MTTVLLLRHEGRRAGPARWAAPAAAVAIAGGLAGLGAANGASTNEIDRMLLAGLEVVFPLALGVAAPAVVARDACRELQLSLPTRYGATLGRRLVTLGAWSAALALLYSAGLWMSGRWSGPAGPAGLLVWLAPGLWLAGLGVAVVVLGRSTAVATTLVGGVWLIEQLFAASIVGHPLGRNLFLFATSQVGHEGDWLVNRLWLLASAGVFAAIAVAALGRPDRLLPSEED